MAQNTRTIDLDAASAARQEAIGQAVEITWKGHTYRLPIEQPMETARHFNKLHAYSDVEPDELPDGATVDAKGRPVLTMAVLDSVQNDGLAVLFCDEPELPYPDDDHPGNPDVHTAGCQWVKFTRSGISREDRNALLQALTAAYSVTEGEAEAPRNSRKSGGAPSRRTGAGTTKQTSATSGAGGTKTAAKKTAARSGNPARKAAASRQS